MTGSLLVASNETGVIRVFALSLSDEEAKALKGDPAAIAEILGTQLDTDHVELFPVSDLEGVGLVGYLAEGNAIPPEQLVPDRAKLDQLDGWVMVVFSRAFGGTAAALRPAQALTLIGTYTEAGIEWTSAETLEADSAKPYTAPAETVRKKPSDAAMSGRIAMAALLVLGVLTWLMIWIGG